MNDTLIKMVASQMGIPAIVLDELKASRPHLVNADFGRDGALPTMVTLTVEVTSPTANFPVVLTLPTAQLKRFPAIYEMAVQLANKA
jgi:hypothetical protein